MLPDSAYLHYQDKHRMWNYETPEHMARFNKPNYYKVENPKLHHMRSVGTLEHGAYKVDPETFNTV